MRRILLWLLLSGGAVLLILAIVAPLFINPQPAAGAPSGHALATAESQFVRIPFNGTDGLELHYRAAVAPLGSQQTFILLHGFTLNLFTWDALFPFFATHGQVFAYDQLPYGLSEKRPPAQWSGSTPYSKAAALEQLFAFMDAMGVERAILVGNSAGGTLALEAARAHPERVQALILIDPWIYAHRPTLPAPLVNTPQLRRVSLLLARYLGEQVPLLNRCYADPTRITPERRQRAAIHTQMAQWDVAWGALLNQSLTEPVTISDHLTAIQQPVLLLTGSEDHLVPVADSARAARVLPHAEFAVLPDCGHVPQEECTDLTQAVIAHWLRALPNSQPSMTPP